MFTGIIEETGIIRQIQKRSVSGSLVIEAETVRQGLKEGDSVAVSGICLTVTSLGRNTFTADVMHETFRKSCMADWRVGTGVNLERAMRADTRFGGHIVTGHIDGTGTIQRIWQDENAVWYEIGAAPKLLRLVVQKGSVAVDGISLTVAQAGKDSFCVSVIPHTRKVTMLSEKKRGDRVNLENDCIGKYVERLLGLQKEATGEQRDSGLSEAFLLQNGFG